MSASQTHLFRTSASEATSLRSQIMSEGVRAAGLISGTYRAEKGKVYPKFGNASFRTWLLGYEATLYKLNNKGRLYITREGIVCRRKVNGRFVIYTPVPLDRLSVGRLMRILTIIRRAARRTY